MMRERENGQSTPSFMIVHGWVDWDRKMESMIGSVDVRMLLESIIESLLAH